MNVHRSHVCGGAGDPQGTGADHLQDVILYDGRSYRLARAREDYVPGRPILNGTKIIAYPCCVLFDVSLPKKHSVPLVYVIKLDLLRPSVATETSTIHSLQQPLELQKNAKKNKKNERLLEWRYWESNPGFESIYDVHNLMSYR
jgi:hypothetical protein